MKALRRTLITILVIALVLFVLALVSDQSFWLYQHNRYFSALADFLHGR